MQKLPKIMILADFLVSRPIFRPACTTPPQKSAGSFGGSQTLQKHLCRFLSVVYTVNRLMDFNEAPQPLKSIFSSFLPYFSLIFPFFLTPTFFRPFFQIWGAFPHPPHVNLWYQFWSILGLIFFFQLWSAFACWSLSSFTLSS